MRKKIPVTLLVLALLITYAALPAYAATGTVTTQTTTNIFDAYNSTTGKWNEDSFKSNGLLSLPRTSNSDYHIWQEVKLEDGAYVTRTYWAQLQTAFALTPDPRIAYEAEPSRMESGFGAQVALQTQMNTKISRASSTRVRRVSRAHRQSLMRYSTGFAR